MLGDKARGCGCSTRAIKSVGLGYVGVNTIFVYMVYKDAATKRGAEKSGKNKKKGGKQGNPAS